MSLPSKSNVKAHSEVYFSWMQQGRHHMASMVILLIVEVTVTKNPGSYMYHPSSSHSTASSKGLGDIAYAGNQVPV